MSRPARIALTVAGSVAGLIALIFVAGIIIVQTQWFRHYIRVKIVSSVEEATGGQASVGAFSFDWQHLRATLREFVLHGLEPPPAPPLFQARLIEVDLTLLSPFSGFVHIQRLLADQPQASVIVFPDGRTNIPSPKIKSTSSRSGLQTVVNLAIGHFDLRNGSIAFADRKANFSADGENLRAQLAYRTATASYNGEIDMSPLNWRSSNQPPIRAAVKLPLAVERDRISLANAQVTTAQSRIIFSGSMEHMLAPRYSARLLARVGLDEISRAAQLTIPLDTTHAPGFVDLEIAASGSSNRLQIESARLNLGNSYLEASGPLRNLAFDSKLALGQLGRLLRVPQQPQGMVNIGGSAMFAANFSYLIKANLRARNVSLRERSTRLAGISLDTAVTADPHQIDLTGLRLSALGGELTGAASLVDLTQLHFSGNIRSFDIVPVARAAGARVGYSGVVSGPVEVEDNIRAPSALIARANLSIAPGSPARGIPISGRLHADYNGRAQTVVLGTSYLALPHTRIDLSGTLERRVQVRMVTHDFADFRPVAAIPVSFHNGNATLNVIVSGSLSSPRIAGQIGMTNFAVEGRPFTRLVANVNAAKTGVAVSNATLARGNFQAQLAAYTGLRDWKPEPAAPLRADVTVRNGDLQDVMAIAGEAALSASGTLTADAHLTGTLGSPQGNAYFTVANGSIEGNHFDNLSTHADFTPDAIALRSLQITAGAARLDASAIYRHSPNNLARGSLSARVASSRVQLADFQSLVKNRPGLRGSISLDGQLTANLSAAAGRENCQVVSLDANLNARGIQMQGRNLGNFTAEANSVGQTLDYNATSDFAGSTIRVAGQSLLTGDHQTSATGSISNLPVAPVLALAGRGDLPFSGVLSANGQVTGTLDNPSANASFLIDHGSAYQEPFDRFEATVAYTNQFIDVPSLHVTAGPSDLDFSGAFAHPVGDFENGQVHFRLRTNSVELASFHTLKQFKPGLAGTLQVAADGAATVRRSQIPLFSSLNANFSARGLSINRKPLGDIVASAQTQGKTVAFNLKSDFANSNIAGMGRMELGSAYPLNADLRFSNVTYAGLSVWTGSPPPEGLEASTDGQISLSGPVTQPADLHGLLQLTRLDAHTSAPAAGVKPRVNLDIHNQGPVTLALNGSMVTIQSAHLTGTGFDFQVSGTAGRALNIKTDGSLSLDTLEAFSSNIFSSGSVDLHAAVTGAVSHPDINGKLDLHNASFNLLTAPNGISDASGAIVFNGTEAVIQNIAGTSGGGKVTLAGYIAYGSPPVQFHIAATATHVFVAYPQTITTEADARVSLSGDRSRSVLSGDVTILNVALQEQTDIGSMLTQAAAPPPSPTVNTGLLGGMTFDVRIRTAPDVIFRTSLTQNLQADANLTLRGAVDSPGMLGRITITEGQVIFFGSKYTINSGSITFSSPNQINPVLNIDLATTSQGVDVTITVSGPLDRLKISYRSDPPLRFDEIVALLATGKQPTTDPVLAAYQPAAPQQTTGQQGLSTILGQGLASPVAGHLQRLFGVTRLSINPLIYGPTTTAQATVTLQQQVTKNITFTYVQVSNSPNPLTISMEWAFSPRWSAIAQRDIYGELDLNFFFKERFH